MCKHTLYKVFGAKLCSKKDLVYTWAGSHRKTRSLREWQNLYLISVSQNCEISFSFLAHKFSSFVLCFFFFSKFRKSRWTTDYSIGLGGGNSDAPCCFISAKGLNNFALKKKLSSNGKSNYKITGKESTWSENKEKLSLNWVETEMQKKREKNSENIFNNQNRRRLVATPKSTTPTWRSALFCCSHRHDADCNRRRFDGLPRLNATIARLMDIDHRVLDHVTIHDPH